MSSSGSKSGSTLHLRVISGFLALAMFSLVAADREIEETYAFSVQLRDPPEGYALMTSLPTVEVTLRGPSREVARVDPSDLQIVTIEGVAADQEIYRLRSSNFDFPERLEIVDIDPVEIPLRFEPLESYQVEIRPNTRGQPYPGYEIVEVRVEPPTVEVRAPAGDGDDAAIFTEMVDVSGIREDVNRRVMLNPLGPFITYDATQEFTLTVDVEERRSEVILSSQRVHVLGPYEFDYELSGEVVDVRVDGPSDVVAQLEESGVLVTVDLSDIAAEEPGTYRVTPQVENLPNGVELLSVYPQRLLVVLMARAAEEPEEESPGVEEDASDVVVVEDGGAP